MIDDQRGIGRALEERLEASLRLRAREELGVEFREPFDHRRERLRREVARGGAYLDDPDHPVRQRDRRRDVRMHGRPAGALGGALAA